MIKEPETLKGKPFTKFIKRHLIFKVYPKLDKIFPKLGLKNSQKSTRARVKADWADCY